MTMAVEGSTCFVTAFALRAHGDGSVTSSKHVSFYGVVKIHSELLLSTVVKVYKDPML